MPNRAGHDGTDFESGVRNYLAEVAGIDVRREVKHGVRDEGDLRAAIHGYQVAIECKRVERVTPALLASYKRQTLLERDNAGAAFGLLVMWRKGKGFRYAATEGGTRSLSFGENVCWVTVEALLMLGGAQGNVAITDEMRGTWVSLTLADAAALMREV